MGTLWFSKHVALSSETVLKSKLNMWIKSNILQEISWIKSRILDFFKKMIELNHPGAARRAPVTSSSLKSKCPTLHLGDRRFILPSPPHQAAKHGDADATRLQAPSVCTAADQGAGLMRAWQTSTARPGLGAFAVAVYQTVCPFSNPPILKRCRLVRVFIIPARPPLAHL